MRTLLAAIAVLLASVGCASAQSSPFWVKFRFDIHEPGSFGIKTIKELGTTEAASMIAAACAAAGGDCSTQAAAAAYLIKQIVVGR
jgi:hypothetical protein